MKQITIIAECVEGIYNYKEDMDFLLKNRKFISSYWYLHGELQDEVGFDKGIIVSNEHLLKKDLEWVKNYSKNPRISYTIYMNCKPDSIYYLEDGIYNVNVLGIDKPCIGYFWTEFQNFDNVIGDFPMMHGLVVFKDDEEGNEYAKEMYNIKSSII